MPAPHRVRSEQELHRLNSITTQLLQQLPGPVTPQQLIEHDHSVYIDWSLIGQTLYAETLHILLELVDQPPIELFLIDANSDFVSSALNALVVSNRIPMHAHIIEAIVCSDTMLPCSFIHLSCMPTVDFMRTTKREEFIQLLCSIPNRVANQMHSATSLVLLPQLFSETMTLHVLRAIDGLSRTSETDFEEYMAQLLSRLIIDFNQERLVWQQFVRIVAELCRHRCRRSEIISKILQQLQRQAIDVICPILLEHTNVSDILGTTAVVVSPDWRYSLCTRIPLLVWFEANTYAFNLIHYLCAIKNDDLVTPLLSDVLELWSNSNAISCRSIEHATYLSKLSILLTICAERRRRQRDNDKIAVNFNENIKQKLFVGIPYYLQAQQVSVRCLGMITAEVILSVLQSNDAAAAKLQFDYSDYATEQLNLIESIRNLPEEFDAAQPSPPPPPPSVATDILCSMIKRISERKNDLVIVSTKKPSTIPSSTKQPEPPSSAIDDLDSDDDLEPFDMSNDVSDASAKAPKFVLDLKDIVRETDDPETFRISIEHAAELIRTQMTTNGSPTLAIELLQILLTLECKFAMDNFERLRLNACVAAVMAHPIECVCHVGAQFYKETGTYSIANKMLMLQVIVEAAEQLSSLQSSGVAAAASTTTELQQMPRKLITFEPNYRETADRLIQKRVALKTRRFATATKNPLKGGQPNRFAPVAAAFLATLLGSFVPGNRIYVGGAHQIKHDIDNILLVHWLQTLATVTRSAENCSAAAAFAGDLIAVTKLLRYHDEAAVRAAVMRLIGSVWLVVPQHRLVDDLAVEMLEIRLWLEAVVQQRAIGGGGRSETNAECRQLATSLMALYSSIMNA